MKIGKGFSRWNPGPLSFRSVVLATETVSALNSCNLSQYSSGCLILSLSVVGIGDTRGMDIESSGTPHVPSPPSTSASPQLRLSDSNQDRRMRSPSGSSQGDAADTEMDSDPASGQLAGRHQPLPKKERTRTLVTPHQAAVLHALLAQVRPPFRHPTYSNFQSTPFSHRHVH